MNEFENKVASNGVLYSRIIASWVKSERKATIPGVKWRDHYSHFEEWLEEELGLPEEEIEDIVRLVRNGKMELEDSAYSFIVKKKREAKELAKEQIREGRKKIIQDLKATGYSLREIQTAINLYKEE